MPGVRRRFGSARGIGSGSAVPRGGMRGGFKLQGMTARGGRVRMPRVNAQLPQLGSPRVHIGPLITVHPRLHFVAFNRNIIRQNWNAINRNPLQRAANLIRIIARRSIKRRKSRVPSAPGTPPFSHMSFGGKTPPFKQIYNWPINFGTGQIIGMVGFDTLGLSGPPVPGLHEHGGRAQRRLYNRKRLNRPQPRSQTGQYQKYSEPKFIKKTVRYPQRAFMLPALMKARKILPHFWANSLRRRAYVGRGR